MIVKCALTPSWSTAIMEGKEYKVLRITKDGKRVTVIDDKGFKTTWSHIFFKLKQEFYCSYCSCGDCTEKR